MNAFVTGNNHIYIHTGLLENLDSYEELEGIIAHEIGHLKLGHVESRRILSKKNSNLINIGIFALLGATLAGSDNNLNGSILIGTDFFYKKQFKYNRTQELEADIFSIKALNKLKKSSIGLNRFFKKIEKRNKLFSNKNNYYSSHPNPENRLEIINSLSQFKDNKLNTITYYKNIELDLQKLQAEAQMKKELMNHEFQLNMQLKKMEADTFKAREDNKENRKDERTKIQATQQSELIDQRNTQKPPKNFESAGNDILGGGFGLNAFDPR